MLGTYFYHEILRKTIIAFGTLFNDINIRHDDRSGGTISETKVPLIYGPKQKFLAKNFCIGPYANGTLISLISPPVAFLWRIWISLKTVPKDITVLLNIS